MFQFFSQDEPYLGPSRLKMLKNLKSTPLQDKRANTLYQEAIRLLIKAHDRISLEQAIDALKYVKLHMEYQDEIENKTAVLAYDKAYILLCAAVKAHNIQDPYGHINEPKNLHIKLLQDPATEKEKKLRKDQQIKNTQDKELKESVESDMPSGKKKLMMLIEKRCAQHEKLFTLYMTDSERVERHQKYQQKVKKLKDEIEKWNSRFPADQINYSYFPVPLHSDEILLFLYNLFTTYEELMLQPRKYKPEYVTEEIQNRFDQIKDHAEGWVPWLRIIYQMIYRAVIVQRFEVADTLLYILDNKDERTLVNLILSDERMTDRETTVVKFRLTAMREVISELRSLCWLEETSVGSIPVPTRLSPKQGHNKEH